MKKTIITGLAILGGVTALSTFAYQNSLGTGNQPRWGRFGSGQTMGSGQFKLPENFAAIQTAMTNKDFTAWKAAIGNNGPFVDKITTQEQFTTFIQMMDAEKSGDTTTAEKLRTELGLEKRGEGKEPRGEFGSGHNENFQAIQTAMTNKDFTAWKASVGDHNPFADKITTQELFNKFVDMDTAYKAGNTTTAEKLRTEL